MRLRKNRRIKVVGILLLVSLFAFFHYLTGVQNTPYYGFYCRLYYLPIILAGLWFCVPGGIATSLLVSVLFAPHLFFKWGTPVAIPVEQYLEILLFNLTGVLTGILSSKINVQSLRAEKNMQQLEESYTKLTQQANLIVEIEGQLRQADRLTALGELSAGIAHEIRNPLGSIRGTAEILRDAFGVDEKYSEFSNILIKEVDRLNLVVEGFLDFARPAPPGQDGFNPGETLNEVLQLCQPQIKKNRTQVFYQKRELPVTMGDPSQFKQVFLNLILNALQAMPSGGELWIETGTSDEGQIIITLRDTGPGIPAADIERIFEPFFTTKKNGTGLGLSITSRIVKHHCGQLSVANVSKGGAEFTLILKPKNYFCQGGGQYGSTDTFD